MITINVNMLKGKIFVFCHEDTRIEPYYPDMQFKAEYKKCGYEITYDMTGSVREKC